MEKNLQIFLETKSHHDAIIILNNCRQEKNYNIGYELCKIFHSLFPFSFEISLLFGYLALETKNYIHAFEIFSSLNFILTEQDLKNINDAKSLIISNIFNDHIFDNHISYNSTIVEKIVNRKPNKIPFFTFTITTCKRFDLFEKTMNSFINCCTDIDKIDYWFCVDDNSSEEDRTKMKEKYPFFEFYFKNFSEKGHSKSMNIIRNKVKTPYIFHMEDDWKFFEKRNFISDCFEILSESKDFGQCLINKNYAETEKDKIIGGIFCQTKNNKRYFIHENCLTQKDYDSFYQKHGNGANCAYWKHYSLRPSLIKKEVFDTIGSFNDNAEHFEAEYSDRYFRKYKSVFLDGIYSIHIGRLTSEINSDKLNAYILNNEQQFKKNKMDNIIISLDRREDRWKNFLQVVPPNFSFRKFSAIDGKKLLPNKQLQRIFEGNDYNMRQGMVGCALSHISLYIELINSECDSFCIFEDDITFVPNFSEKFSFLYSSLPKEWDICFLGHHLWKKFKTDDYYDKTIFPKIEKLNTLQSLQLSMGGTGGYIISKNGALKFLEFINKFGMINGIDTMQQKSADFLNIYYCKPHLIYSECWTPENNPDTDIQHDFNSLDLLETVTDYPDRLKKNNIFDIKDAIKYKEDINIISLSETTHASEAIAYITKNADFFPFDKTDGGNFEEYFQILQSILTFSDIELFYFCKKWIENTKISFPHEKFSKEDLLLIYMSKFHNLKRTLKSGNNILFIHVSRWKKTDAQVFENFINFVLKFNKNCNLLIVNGCEKVEHKNIFITKTDFPENFHNDDWPHEKIVFDQNIFRVNLIHIVAEFLKHLKL